MQVKLVKSGVLALIVACLPLALVQPAEAAGSFVPLSGNQVQINFTSANNPAANAWYFIFSGANPLGGMCPSGGNFSVVAVGNTIEAECSFGAATTSGQVTIVLDAPYSCTAAVTDYTSSPASGNVQEPPITCTAQQTTTTTTTSTSTTTTTTTEPSTTTTTTTAPATTTTEPSTTTTTLHAGPCKCDSLIVFVAVSGVSSAQNFTSSGLSRVTLQVSWTLVCSHGVGRCKASVVVAGPPGGSTTWYAAVSSGGSGGGGVKQGGQLHTIGLSCSGTCGATSHGWFFVQWLTKSHLLGNLNFNFATHCSGLSHTQTIAPYFGSGGRFFAKQSHLGVGKIH